MNYDGSQWRTGADRFEDPANGEPPKARSPRHPKSLSQIILGSILPDFTFSFNSSISVGYSVKKKFKPNFIRIFGLLVLLPSNLKTGNTILEPEITDFETSWHIFEHN